MEKYKPYAFLLLAAVLYTLGFPNIFGILIPFTPIIATAIILYYIFTLPTTKQRLLYYLYYNLIITLLSFYWITNTLQEFGGLPWIVAALMNACYALVFNPHYFVLIFFLHWKDTHLPHLNKFFFSTGLFNVFLAIFLTSIEYFLPQQFPVMLGQPWIVLSDYLGAATYLGLPVFSFLSYLVALEMIRMRLKRKASFINLSSVLIFIFINPFLVQRINENEFKSFNIRLVQANISNFLKLDSEGGGPASVKAVLERYEELSLKPFNIVDKKLDLIVWPETAYPYPIRTNKKNILASPVPPLIQNIIYKSNAAMLIGGYDHNKENSNGSYFKTEYNASLYFNTLGQLEEVYHKHVLIPFGETLPFGPLNEVISNYVPEMAFFAEGSKKPIFETDNHVHFISSICYEILRPEFVREYLNNTVKFPNLMINLTNDSWYGDTVEPELHLFLARWRAIEFNLPILRATNSGISTFIGHNGQEVRRLAYNETGNLDLSLKLPKKDQLLAPTFFQQYGFWGILPIWFLYFIFHIILIKLDYDKNS